MKNFEFNFNEQQVNLILNGLGKLPAEQSIELILEIKQKANEQIVQQRLKEKEEINTQ
jgi:hypothetical protein